MPLCPDLMLMYLVPSTLAALMEATESTGMSCRYMFRDLHLDANQALRILGTGERDAS